MAGVNTSIQGANPSAKGVIELATNAETLAGTDTSRAVTPDDLKYVLDRRIQQYSGVKGADIASATTTDLANATGNVIDITGTTTIAGFGTVAAGATFMLRFTGALTLTYNAASMILPGARSITTEAGDRATFVSLGSGNWLCQEFLKANGRCLGIQPVITVSSSRNISAFEMRGQTLVVTGAYTLSLPSAEVGNKCTIVASTAAVYSVDVAVGTDVIVLNGTALTAGNKVTSDGTINNEMEIECRIAGRYHIKSTVNLAIDGGA
jgi:hypothetical protein